MRSPLVLLVDQHLDSLAMYSYGLLAMGLQPLMAGSADSGYARALDHHPDVVVTDLALPREDGLELVRQLRGDAQTAHIGIIMLAGHVSGSLKAAALGAGCDRILRKPCMPDELARHIHEILASTRHCACRGDGLSPA
jgi:DNA-binding response OmpR family regulator